MTDDELSELPNYPWMKSRIPAVDALAVFVVDGPARDPAIREALERPGRSRWYPKDGGHLVLTPYEGGDYDPLLYTVEPDAWDHEHCDACGANIPAMTLCHVTQPGQPYILLCAECFERNVASSQRESG